MTTRWGGYGGLAIRIVDDLSPLGNNPVSELLPGYRRYNHDSMHLCSVQVAGATPVKASSFSSTAHHHRSMPQRWQHSSCIEGRRIRKFRMRPQLKSRANPNGASIERVNSRIGHDTLRTAMIRQCNWAFTPPKEESCDDLTAWSDQLRQGGILDTANDHAYGSIGSPTNLMDLARSCWTARLGNNRPSFELGPVDAAG